MMMMEKSRISGCWNLSGDNVGQSWNHSRHLSLPIQTRKQPWQCMRVHHHPSVVVLVNLVFLSWIRHLKWTKSETVGLGFVHEETPLRSHNPVELFLIYTKRWKGPKCSQAPPYESQSVVIYGTSHTCTTSLLIYQVTVITQ